MGKPNFVHGFSKNNKCGSKLIRWGTKNPGQLSEETPSHYFIVFFRRIVIESKLESGVRITYWKKFLKQNDVVAMYLPLPHTEKMERAAHTLDRILDATYGQSYDYMGVLYFAYRVLLKKFFGKPMPAKNYWDSPDKFFCDEIFSIVSGKDMSMKSPNELYYDMKGRPDDYKELKVEEIKA